MRALNFRNSKLNRIFLRDERGTQLVELAIVLPLVLILFGAIAEFGRFFYTYSTLSKATRAGARYLVSQVPGTKDGSAKNLVVYGSTTGTGTPIVGGFDSAKVQITYSAAAKTTTVSIQNFNYVPLFDLGKLIKQPSLSLSVNVNARTTMRQMVQ